MQEAWLPESVIPDGSLVMGSPAGSNESHLGRKLGIMRNSKEYVTVSLEMKKNRVCYRKKKVREKNK